MADSACCERREATPASLEGPAPAARPPADRPHRVAVLGVGNDLVGDDGVGVAVLKALQGAGLERRFPGVVLVDAGTAAFDAVALLQETVKRLVIVDAVRAAVRPVRDGFSGSTPGVLAHEDEAGNRRLPPARTARRQVSTGS